MKQWKRLLKLLIIEIIEKKRIISARAFNCKELKILDCLKVGQVSFLT